MPEKKNQPTPQTRKSFPRRFSSAPKTAQTGRQLPEVAAYQSLMDDQKLSEQAAVKTPNNAVVEAVSTPKPAEASRSNTPNPVQHNRVNTPKPAMDNRNINNNNNVNNVQRTAQPNRGIAPKPAVERIGSVQPQRPAQPNQVQNQGNNTPNQVGANQPPKRRGRPPSRPANANPSPIQAAVVQTAVQAVQGILPQHIADARGRGRKKTEGTPLKIISLGGLGEIGKNMTLIEYQNDIIIVDCGLAFPDDDMPGIDLVIPDFTYAIKNRDRIRGVVLTHGHEDHIGALGYLLKEIDVPIYSARLTIGLVEGKLKEHGVLGRARLNVVKAGDTVKLGCMSVEFIAVNHSIPDACALAIFTPVGTLVHTGDFKIDYTPIDGVMINLARFGALGSQGVLALMSDSTNAERPGSTPSEKKVGESFEMLFKKAEDKRIIVASFSSNVHRIQQVVDAAVRNGRRVVVSGRSMENVTAKAIELGYLKIPPNTLVEIDRMRQVPDSQLVIITTGSQGEPMSALTRMARGDHRKISVTCHDFIIISATPIPGNEKLVGKVINDLMQLGADVIYEGSMGIHVSGHACRDEIKTIIGLTKPKFFIPVHGEYKHLAKNRELAIEMGIPADNIIISEIGRVIEMGTDSVKIVATVPSGAIMVDGIGIGDVGSIVLRDRKLLAEDGLIIAVATLDSKTGELLAGPDVVSRGFVYVRESEELLTAARQVCKQALISSATAGDAGREWTNLKQAVKDQLGSYLYSKTKRRPMILPIIQEVDRG